MQFTFIDAAGTVLFIRDDAEQASWTVEEMTLHLDFPYDSGKVIATGQRVLFHDATNAPQVYEVKQAKTVEPDGMQQVTAEHICISELSDEHVDKSELTDVFCSAALSGVLAGTLWNVGRVAVNPVSSVDISRGSVWQAVLQIKTNWNVYIEPRLTINSSGQIGRYLDILSTDGEWNGVRLSVDKNMVNPAVTFDDTEVATALYGYGGTVNTEDSSYEVTFRDVVWAKTADHPAKPAGQLYLEYPAATTAYGRNGRPRFGFYQNTDITDPELLLRKTWEALQNSAAPDVSIEGTIADLYRMGYADQPIRLHDIALVEILPAGLVKRLQITRMTVNLLDASDTVVNIGAYIPNIIYIERQTNEQITGSRGGGGGNKSTETAWREFVTTVQTFADGTGMRIQAVQNKLDETDEELALQIGRIDVAYNQINAEVIDRRNADGVLAGRIQVNANKVSMVVEETSGGYAIKTASIIVAINEDSTSEIHIDADNIYIGNEKSTTVIAGKCELSDVTASYIASKLATVANLTVNNVLAGGVSIVTGMTVSPVATQTYVSGCPYDLQIVQSGNTYTLQWKRLGGEATWSDVGSFSRATTLTDAWNSGTITVTASPQAQTLIRTLVEGAKENTDGTPYTDATTWRVPINAEYSSGGSTYTESTGKYVYVDASTFYAVTHAQFTRVAQPVSYGTTYSTAGKLNLGGISKAGITAPGYLELKFSVHGHTETAYVTINT